MQLNSDFKDLLREFSREQVRYLVVGGYAVIEHAEPRYTKDLDVWVDRAAPNAERVFRALKRFGAPLMTTTARDFTRADLVYQVGVEPVRIDILMSLKALKFEEAWKARLDVHVGRMTVHVLSLEHLIRNKRRVGRPQDLADVQALSARQRKRGRG